MIGYVLKMFPRFSETFVLQEILELERTGHVVDVLALRKPDDGRFHEDLARVRAAVGYLPERFHHAPATFLAAHARQCARTPLAWIRAAVDAVRYGAEGRRGFLRAPLLARHARARGWTRMHAHFANQPAAAALFAARWTGIPFTVTAHAKDLYHRSASPALLRALLREARSVVTVSDYNARWLRRLAPAASGRVVRIYNGIDLGRFRPDAAREANRGSDPLVLAVGRLVEKKGFDVLLDACARLRPGGVPFRCEIVGKGPEEPRLAARIQALGLQDRVRLVGPLSREAVFERLAGAAVLAAPCVVAADGNRDGLPTVIVEAAAMGVPTVTTDVTGIVEAVADGQTGRVVEPGDAEALADALGEVLDDPERMSALGRGARRLAEERFDLVRNVGELARLFDERPAGAVPAGPSGSLARESAR